MHVSVVVGHAQDGCLDFSSSCVHAHTHQEQQPPPLACGCQWTQLCASSAFMSWEADVRSVPDVRPHAVGEPRLATWRGQLEDGLVSVISVTNFQSLCGRNLFSSSLESRCLNQDIGHSPSGRLWEKCFCLPAACAAMTWLGHISPNSACVCIPPSLCSSLHENSSGSSLNVDSSDVSRVCQGNSGKS